MRNGYSFLAGFNCRQMKIILPALSVFCKVVGALVALTCLPVLIISDLIFWVGEKIDENLE